MTSPGFTSSSRSSSSNMLSVMSSATSSRTGEPNRRRANSRSSACSRSSSRSSSTSKSALRVMRNAWCSTISMPGNSTGRNAAISSSIGRKRISPWPSPPSVRESSSTKRSTLSGTLTRAKCCPPSSGRLTVTARFRLSPLTNGNGCAGSTASGVRTGNTCSCEVRRQLVALGLIQIGPRDDVDAFGGQRRAHRIEEHPRVAGRDLLGLLADAAQLLTRGQTVGRADRQPHLVAALEAGDPDHVELVEVGGEDRQKLGPLQQRQRGVVGQRQHARVEVQPAQFAVEVAILGQRVVDRVRRVAAGGAPPAVGGCRARRRRGVPASVSVTTAIIAHHVVLLRHSMIIHRRGCRHLPACLLRTDSRCRAMRTGGRRARPRAGAPTARSSGVSTSQRRPGQAPVSSNRARTAVPLRRIRPELRVQRGCRTRTAPRCPCRAGRRRSCAGGGVRRRSPRRARSVCNAGRSPCSTTILGTDAATATLGGGDRVVQRVAVAVRRRVGQHLGAEFGRRGRGGLVGRDDGDARQPRAADAAVMVSTSMASTTASRVGAGERRRQPGLGGGQPLDGDDQADTGTSACAELTTDILPAPSAACAGRAGDPPAPIAVRCCSG